MHFLTLLDVAVLEVISFGVHDFGGYELLDIPDFGGIDLLRLQFWRLRALEVTVLEFLILTQWVNECAQLALGCHGNECKQTDQLLLVPYTVSCCGMLKGRRSGWCKGWSRLWGLFQSITLGKLRIPTFLLIRKIGIPMQGRSQDFLLGGANLVKGPPPMPRFFFVWLASHVLPYLSLGRL